METLRRTRYTGERALFASSHLKISECIFEDGESPLKESSDLDIENSIFRWKYPLWYCHDVKLTGSTFGENGRAGVWYTNDIEVTDCLIDGPKNFRKCRGLSLNNVTFTDAKETLWWCDDVKLCDVRAVGNYFAMGSDNMAIRNLELSGNYCFDGSHNITISDSRLMSKDAFWNSENITVKNCFISGEYLGWNSKNLTLIDCTIESLQGMCYIENLVMKNCVLINTTLAFEYSTVDADIASGIDSVINPTSGTIKAERIGELIMEKDRIDPDKTNIICKE